MVAGLILALAALPQASPPAEAIPVVVVVSVDQLASWTFREARPHFGSGGFRRLLDEGVYYENCAFRYGCTKTGPGHATIGTGVLPEVHGIVSNNWWDQASRKRVYCVEGDSPQYLKHATMADTLEAATEGRAKTLSLSWKDRASILMGGRDVDLAVWVDGNSGRFVSSEHYAKSLPEWLERLNADSATDRYFGQSWSRFGPATAYAGLVDARPFEGRSPNGRSTLPQKVDGGLSKPGPMYWSQHLYYSPFGNEVLLDVVDVALRAERFGADDVTDLLMLSFSALDKIGHRFGPRSVETRDMYLRLDRQIAQLLACLDAVVGRDRYRFFLTGDHGISPLPEAAAKMGISAKRDLRLPAKLLAAMRSALRREYGKAPDDHAGWIFGAVEELVFFDHRAPSKGKIDPIAAARLAAAAVTGMPGIRGAFATADLLAETPADPLEAALALGLHGDRSGDVVVLLEPYWSTITTPATHGTPYAFDREVPLFVLGPGFGRGEVNSSAVSPAIIASLVGW